MENQDSPSENVASAVQDEAVLNPLQYRPATVNRQRDSPMSSRII